MINRPPSIPQAAITLQRVIPRPVIRKTPVPDADPYSWEHLVQEVKELAKWSEKDLKGYLDKMGYEFNPETYREIVITLQLSLPRWKEKAQVVTVWDRYYDICPICGGPTIPDPSRDRKFGAEYGWKCIADRFHFLDWRWIESHSKKEEK